MRILFIFFFVFMAISVAFGEGEKKGGFAGKPKRPIKQGIENLTTFIPPTTEQ
ncbi:unnamed protein product [Meloidogyne enterolobii]|uniref:Uncharacterized protein n=1 Tax=Meloidogyne enterolobii TaxID=390850 RepID=A0ACB0YZ46_MELEN